MGLVLNRYHFQSVLLWCTEVIGAKVAVGIASATAIGLVVMMTVVATTTVAMAVMTTVVAGSEMKIVIAVVGMILIEVTMTETEVMMFHTLCLCCAVH